MAWAHLVTPGKLAYARGKRPDIACVLCAILARHPEVERLVIFETARWAVSANLYPYNPGHVMLMPRRHVEDVRELRRAEQREFHDLQACTLTVLEATYAPHGFNIGFNLGKDAGASQPHLHLHVVPRYRGELGYMDLLAQTRTVVEDPHTTVRRLRTRLRRAWRAYT